MTRTDSKPAAEHSNTKVNKWEQWSATPILQNVMEADKNKLLIKDTALLEPLEVVSGKTDWAENGINR